MKRKDMKIAFLGFVIALAGVTLGFFGYQIQARWMSVASFFITCLGILVGAVGIAYGWFVIWRVPKGPDKH